MTWQRVHWKKGVKEKKNKRKERKIGKKWRKWEKLIENFRKYRAKLKSMLEVRKLFGQSFQGYTYRGRLRG